MMRPSKFAPSVSNKTRFIIGLLALAVLPAGLQTALPRAWAAPDTSATDSPAGEANATSEFPFKLCFEQGATRFEPGDDITIDEVRGTAGTFQPGNIYWIKGRYKLSSRGRASLSAYTTALESKDAVSTPLKVQSVAVERGEGTFTLFLPMTHAGLPHVSFYPAQRGQSFGGNYFGTGESVLKRWWDSK